MKQYAVCSVELDKIQEQMLDVHDNNDLFDSVAPFMQNIQYKDEAKAVDFTENYDLSNDIGIPSTTTSHEPLILNEMQDQKCKIRIIGNLFRHYNKKKREFFYHILHLTKTSHNFLSGGAGVCKSNLVKSLYQAALKYWARSFGTIPEYSQ